MNRWPHKAAVLFYMGFEVTLEACHNNDNDDENLSLGVVAYSNSLYSVNMTYVTT